MTHMIPSLLYIKEDKMNIAEMIKLGMKGIKPSEIKELKESGMTAEDCIKLAENGYSVADMKELVTLAGDDEILQPGNEEKKEPVGPQVNESGNEGDEGNEDKLKEKDAELEKLKTELAAAQEKNSRRNLGTGGEKDPREELKDIFRNIY